MSEAETGTEAMPEVEEALDGIDVEQPLVGIIMGSASDKETMAKAEPILDEAGIAYEVRVMSAHRTPDTVVEYCRMAKERGLKVIIAGAGLSAALPGVAAAHTELPVIGVPISAGTLGGIDALLSASQMPPGVPVAAVGIDNSKNAAHLAIRIINL
jgi:5-(carboxyamino)imidazole ribonucleotide mutase